MNLLERTSILTSSLEEIQAQLEQANDQLRSIQITHLNLEAYGKVLEARLEIAGVIGRLRHYTQREAA